MNYFKNIYKSSFNLINHFYRNKKVVMLHTARSGSTVLSKMLNNHSKVFWGGELFNNFTISESVDKRRQISYEIKRNANRRISRIYGFETKFLPLQTLAENRLNLQVLDFIEILHDLGVDKFILLKRRNYLRRVISVEVGLKTKTWHSSKKQKKIEKICLDVDRVHTADKVTSLLELFAIMDQSYNQASDHLRNYDLLSLVYEEDILRDPVIAYRKVCNFFEIPEESKKVELHKTNPFEIKDMLENFEEVKKVLKGTKYEWMLFE